MLAYKNVYSLQEGRLVKNKENKIEYCDENGKKRVKTNPTYKDFARVGKYPLKEEKAPSYDSEMEELIVSYRVEDGYIVPKYEIKAKEGVEE